MFFSEICWINGSLGQGPGDQLVGCLLSINYQLDKSWGKKVWDFTSNMLMTAHHHVDLHIVIIVMEVLENLIQDFYD